MTPYINQMMESDEMKSSDRNEMKIESDNVVIDDQSPLRPVNEEIVVEDLINEQQSEHLEE